MNLYFRLLVFMIRVRFRSRLSMWDTSTVSSPGEPADLDVQRHMNNGRYLTLMDLGRMDLMLRSGFWKKVTDQGCVPGHRRTVHHLPSLPDAVAEVRAVLTRDRS